MVAATAVLRSGMVVVHADPTDSHSAISLRLDRTVPRPPGSILVLGKSEEPVSRIVCDDLVAVPVTEEVMAEKLSALLGNPKLYALLVAKRGVVDQIELRRVVLGCCVEAVSK